MNASELQRIKEFYRQASSDEQCTVRNIIASRYYYKSPVFSDLDIDGYDFCEGDVAYDKIPEQIWQLLTDDTTIETVEDLVADCVLSDYESDIKGQVRDKGVEHSTREALKLARMNEAQIDTEVKAYETEGGHFDFQKETDRWLKALPILDKKKFLEQATMLVKMREGGIMSMGRSERPKG